MSARNLVSLVVLGVLWGGSFLFIRVAVPAFGPAALVAVRVLVASVLLLAWAGARGEMPSFRQRWRHYLLLGAFNVALPFTLVAAAELVVPASLAAILMATIPLVTASVAAGWLGESLSGRQALGLALGFAGVGVLVGWSPLPLRPAVLLAIGALLLATVCYALAGIYTAKAFRGVSPTEQTIGQQLAAFVLLLPLIAVIPPRAWPSAGAAGAVLVLAVFSTAVAYLIFFRLIHEVSPTRTATVAYLVPLFGTAWGAIALREPVGPSTLVGLGVILAGVALATRTRLPLPAPRQAKVGLEEA